VTTAYVDASALTKLVLDEADSPAMERWYVESEQVVCSRVGIVETRRAAQRRKHDGARLAQVLQTVDVIELDADLAGQAGSIGPPMLRTLDAIHLASAVRLTPALDAFVTYDDRLAEAARAAGLPVVRPA